MLHRSIYRAVATVLIGGVILSGLRPLGAQPLLSGPSGSATDELEETKKALDQARTKAKTLEAKASGLKQDVMQIRQELVKTARVIQYHELRVAKIRQRVEELDNTKVKIRKKFERRRRQLGTVLAALQRIARKPPESLFAQPVAPADMVRSLVLLRATLPRLEEEAENYRKDLNVLIVARDEAKKRHDELNQEVIKLNDQRVRLRRLHGRKSRLRRRMVLETDHAARRAMSLSKQVVSLRELVNRLDLLRAQSATGSRFEPERRRGETPKRPNLNSTPHSPGQHDPKQFARLPPSGFSGKPFNSQKGLVSYPVVGRVAARYGQPIAKGRTHKGLTIETGSAAQVIAPYEGKVAFSGPFRSYGELLIIEHNGGYHTLLAGMVRIDVAVGQWVLTGEPVAVMRGQGAHKPLLYLEIRRNSQPINPLPWLAMRRGNISG